MTFENVKIPSFLRLLFYIAIISGVIIGLSQGGKLRWKGPTGHCTGSTIANTQKKT